MLVLGGIAGIIMVLGLLTILGLLGYYFQFAALNAIFFLIGVAGGIVMAWAGWQAFQAEGGKFQMGSGTGGSSGGSAPPPPPPGAPSS